MADSALFGESEKTPDWVNAQRTEFEFKAGLEVALKHAPENPVFLFEFQNSRKRVARDSDQVNGRIPL